MSFKTNDCQQLSLDDSFITLTECERKALEKSWAKIFADEIIACESCFSTFNNSILAFKQWLLDNNCHDVCMESTGKYWVRVFNLLEDEINVTIANPKWVKAVKGNKDDTKDSKWIGDLFRLGLVKGSYVPCKVIRILREYTRYRYKLVSCRSSEKIDIRKLLLFVMSLSILLFSISLGSHPCPSLTTCLKNRVCLSTTKKSLLNFSGASNPKKMQ